MSSLFDTEVRSRRQHTPWASVSAPAFMREAALNEGWQIQGDVAPEGAVLTCRYRRAVSTSVWWELSWTDETGQRRSVGSQDFQLLLWRAAEVEMQARAKAEREEQGGARQD